MGFKLIDYSGKYLLFVLFEASWSLWLLVLDKKCVKDKMFVSNCILLFIIPFFTMGEWNDFCMRVSLPCLALLSFYVCERHIDLLQRKSYFCFFIILLLLFMASGGYLSEFKALVFGKRSMQTRVYAIRENELFGKVYTRYQYVRWLPSRGVDLLLKDEVEK